MKDLTVLILTHNREHLFIESLLSVINQDCNDFDIVVSDNSTNLNTYNLLVQNELINKIKYIKRDSEYKPFDHFNLCLSEIKTKYFMFFHDDDIMRPNMIRTLYKEIVNSDFVCVGSNAYILSNDEYTKIKAGKFSKKIIINSPNTLINQYLTDNIAVYPSYMYSKEKISKKNILFEEKAGKYSDVIWLLNLLTVGNISWLSEPLMYYRVHKNQDSQKIDYNAQLRLIREWNKYDLHYESRKKLTNKHLHLIYSKECENKVWKHKFLYKKFSFFNLYLKVIVKEILLKKC